MAHAQVLVVEDEAIVAKDIKDTLKNLEYGVTATASSGQEALRKAAETTPDLVLMDIVLRGDMDGVETAARMRDRFQVPIVYLTAYADSNTLERAKVTEPFGYIVKPFQEKELQRTIEMALYKSRMERRLRESEEWLATTLKSISDAVIATDGQGDIQFINPVAQALTGWGERSALGRASTEVFHTLDARTRSPCESPVMATLRQGAVAAATTHAVLVGKGRKEIPIEASAGPIRDDRGKIRGVVLVFRDITERKQAQEQVHHYLRRIIALREISVATSSTLDLHAVLDVLLEKMDIFLPYAASAVRLFNREAGKLEPIACRNLDEEEWKADKPGRGRLSELVFARKAPLMVQNVHEDPQAGDREFLRKNNLVSYLGIPLVAQGDVLGVLSCYTKEKHVFSSEEVDFLSTLTGQAAIAIHNSQLYEQSREQAAELERAYKVKSEILNFLSHELRIPLNVIMGYAEIIREGKLGEINSRQEETLRRMTRYTNDLFHMIDTILQAAKLEAGGVQVAAHPFHLGQFMEELRGLYDVPLDREVVLIWNYPADLPVIRTDSWKLRHILQNLIHNAIKFTDRGQIAVSAKIHPGTKTLELTVADTGAGISPDVLPTIFQGFRQLDTSFTRSRGGVGLGLSIVKKFAEMLRAKVEVESELNKGSTFTVRIPYEI